MSNKLINKPLQNSNDIFVNDGSRVYNIKNQRGELLGKFTFNPSEVDGIIMRYDHAAAIFKELQDSIGADADGKKLAEVGERMKDEIDYLFNADVSGTFFKFASPFSILESGEFYVENIIKSIQAVIEKETGRRMERVKSRASKYTQKYGK